MRNLAQLHLQQSPPSTGNCAAAGIALGRQNRRTSQDGREASGAELRRWTNGGRKVEPSERFRPPHWGLLDMSNFCAAAGAPPARLGRGLTVTPIDETAGICEVPTS
jgi:hypothetical protein